MAHVILLSFTANILIVSFNILNLYKAWLRTHHLLYRHLSVAFLGLVIFLLFSLLSGYTVVNIIPANSVLYTCLESTAVAGISILVLNTVFAALRIMNITGSMAVKRIVASGICLLTAIFIFSKFSHHIFNRYPASFFLLKNISGILFLLIIFSSGWIILLKGSGTVPRRLRLVISIYLLMTPLTGMIDAYLIRFKLYSEEISLSLSYPLTTILIFAAGIYLNLCIVKYLRTCREPDTRIEHFCQEFNLSSREREVLSLLINGKGNRGIADELYISLSTVKNHVHSILQKTGCKRRFELITSLNSLN